MLYGAPFTAQKILVVLPAHERVWGLDSSTAATGKESKWADIAAEGSCLCGAPYSVETVLVVKPPQEMGSAQQEARKEMG